MIEYEDIKEVLKDPKALERYSFEAIARAAVERMDNLERQAFTVWDRKGRTLGVLQAENDRLRETLCDIADKAVESLKGYKE